MKGEDELRKTNELAYYWGKEITPVQLQLEMKRMAGDSKNPKLLKEVWNALQNDPRLIAECIARPELTDKMNGR